MSGRGGRGGRGGRARGGGSGSRNIAKNSVPFDADPNLTINGKPSELFPEYNVPRAPSLSKKEDKQVTYFLLFREQCHDGPLYTQARTWTQDESKPQRTYGQEQVNKRYGQTSKATVDPFLAVPTYSQKFQQPERTLPDLESRPFAKEFFPPELHATLDGEDAPSGPAHKRRRVGPKTLALSNITSLRTAEELFLPSELSGNADLGKAMQVISTIEKRAEEEDDGFLSGDDDDDWVKDNADDDEEGNLEDPDQYDDESGDDYNAEQYFDGNQDDDDYDDGGGDDGGDYM